MQRAGNDTAVAEHSPQPDGTMSQSSQQSAGSVEVARDPGSSL